MKRRWIVWLSLWLSLGSVLSACGNADSQSTTLETAAEVPTPADPTMGVSETIAAENQAELQKFLQEDHQEKLRKAAEARAAAKKARELQRQQEALRASRNQQRSAQTTTAPPAATPEPEGNGCGGNLPPCWVMKRESKSSAYPNGGDPRIWNGGCYAPAGWTGISPCGSSSASGKWQFTRGTWNGYKGYLNAADAPVSVQDEKARATWAGGRGCGHWSAC